MAIRVLVVDDTEMNLEIAKDILEMFDVEADTVDSGKKALELIETNHYDIIFTDYFMPEMNGVELAENIRKINDDYYRNVPIIALTGDTSDEARLKFEQAGINDFLEKPINPVKLSQITERWSGKVTV